MKFWRIPFRLIFCLTLVFSCSQQSPDCQTQTIAAFDIGSGSTKVMVADKDPCSKTLLSVYFEDSMGVGYAQDLKSQGDKEKLYFSQDIIDQGTNAIKELNEKVETFNPDFKRGVATEAFRQAQNAPEVLESWRKNFGIQAQIISQEKEAILAYELVRKNQNIDHNRLLVWDMGGGSQQLIWTDLSQDDYHFFNSQIASVTFKNRALETLSREEDLQSPNPIKKDEVKVLKSMAKDWINENVTQELIGFINKSPQIYALGGVHGASLVRQMQLKPGDAIERSHLKETIKKQTGKTDEQIGGGYAETDMTNLILVYSLMKVYGIDSYYFISADLTEAIILLYEELLEN